MSEAEKQRLENLGTTYDRSRQFDVMDKAASNEGLAVGGPVGLGLGIAAGGVVGSKMSIMANNVLDDAPNTGEQKAQEQCPTCHAKYNVGMKFCPECGTAVKVVCKSCGYSPERPMKFCPECGAEM